MTDETRTEYALTVLPYTTGSCPRVLLAISVAPVSDSSAGKAAAAAAAS